MTNESTTEHPRAQTIKKTGQQEAIDSNNAYLHNIQHYTNGSKIQNTTFSPKTTHMQPLASIMHIHITPTSPYETPYI
jgi:hypothetical protein